MADGFALPESKGSVAWIDQDRLFVATDFGPGSMTDSGYPRIVKEWRRGTPLHEARLVFEAGSGDLSASARRDLTPGYERDFVTRQIGFYSSELFLREGDRLVKIDKPIDANAFAVRDQLLIELRSDWTIGGRTWPQGALLAIDFARFMAGERDFEALFTPTDYELPRRHGGDAQRPGPHHPRQGQEPPGGTAPRERRPGPGARSPRPPSARSASPASTRSNRTSIS